MYRFRRFGIWHNSYSILWEFFFSFLFIFSPSQASSVLIHLIHIILERVANMFFWKPFVVHERNNTYRFGKSWVSKSWHFRWTCPDLYLITHSDTSSAFVVHRWCPVPDRRFRVSFCGWIWVISSSLRFCPPSVLRFVMGLFLSTVTVPRGFSMPSGVQPAFSRESLSSQREGLKPC